jgi:hypothetical protein
MRIGLGKWRPSPIGQIRIQRMKALFACAVGAGALLVIGACADQPLPPDPGPPVLNVDPARHGNLAAAQELSRRAYDRLTVAQQDNRYDLGGHAARAKAILREVNEEIKLAAEAANRR